MRLQKQRQQRERWDSPIPDYEIITLEACKLMFQQAKDNFEETVSESEELTKRSMNMLFLLLPSVAAVIGFSIVNQEKLRHFDHNDYMLILAATILLVNCVVLLFQLMSPKGVYYRGSEPEDMIRQEFFQLRDAKQVEKALFISEIERYQIKIEQMELKNAERTQKYTEIIQSFAAMVVIGMFLLLRCI